MNSPKLSIIIPIYNTEKYLRRCIDSILSQSFTDYELLLIDDGSKDSSGAICEEYAAKDSRIRVFHKENGGVSSARNVGLDNAQGEWIYFMDADDELERNGLNVFIASAKEYDAPLVLAGYHIYAPSGEILFDQPESGKGCIDKNTALLWMFKSYPFYSFAYLWEKLLKKSLLDKRRMRFNEHLHYSEDYLFCVQYICSLQDDVVIPYDWTPVYKYLMRDTGAMNTIRRYTPKVLSMSDSMVEMGKTLRRAHCNREIMNAFYLTARQQCGFVKDSIYNSGAGKRDLLRVEVRLLRSMGITAYFLYFCGKMGRTLKRRIRSIIGSIKE